MKDKITNLINSGDPANVELGISQAYIQYDMSAEAIVREFINPYYFQYLADKGTYDEKTGYNYMQGNVYFELKTPHYGFYICDHSKNHSARNSQKRYRVDIMDEEPYTTISRTKSIPYQQLGELKWHWMKKFVKMVLSRYNGKPWKFNHLCSAAKKMNFQLTVTPIYTHEFADLVTAAHRCHRIPINILADKYLGFSGDRTPFGFRKDICSLKQLALLKDLDKRGNVCGFRLLRVEGGGEVPAIHKLIDQVTGLNNKNYKHIQRRMLRKLLKLHIKASWDQVEESKPPFHPIA